MLRAKRVITPFAGHGTPVTVTTSASVGARMLPRADFTQDEIAAHTGRLRSGSTKGRVLYVLAGTVPIAFMGVHVPDRGPIVGEALVVSSAMTPRQKFVCIEALIQCATQLSEACGRTSAELGWTTNRDETRTLLAGFDFAPSSKPAWCDRTHYLLRRDR